MAMCAIGDHLAKRGAMMTAKGTRAGEEKGCASAGSSRPLLQGKLRGIGGSMSDEWNSMLADQVRQALWFFPSDDGEAAKRRRQATIDVMIGLKPAQNTCPPTEVQ